MLTFTVAARADTYQIFNVGNANEGAIFGIDDAGTVAVFARCKSYACLDFYTDGIFVNQVGYSSFPDPAPFHFDNGTPCKPFPQALSGQCNHGRVAYFGDFENPTRFGIYSGPDPVADFVSGGTAGSLYINDLGDIAWIDGSIETDRVAIDLTSREAPEPGTFLLVGSAGIVLAGAFRRP